MQKQILILGLLMISCSKHGVDNLKGYIEYGMESKYYVRWAADQQITWDLFQGEPNGDGIFHNYFGLYFFYDVRDSLKFNATVFLDKRKSWVKPKAEWGESARFYEQAQKQEKLQFDYYECVIRELRKYLNEHKNTLNTDEIRNVSGVYYNRARSEWGEIQASLGNDIYDARLAPIRQSIDARLEELNEFDTRVNSIIP